MIGDDVGIGSKEARFYAGKGEEVFDKKVSFKLGGKQADLLITKTVAVGCASFAVGVRFLGFDEKGLSQWRFRINSGNELPYFDSIKAIFASDGENLIKITETDSKTTADRWVDLSEELHTLRHTPPEPLKALIAKGLLFKPNEGRLKKVLSNDNVVILYTWEGWPRGRTCIYVARPGDTEFIKCKVKSERRDVSMSLECDMEVSIGEEEEIHQLRFPQGEESSAYQSKKSWDGAALKITMPKDSTIPQAAPKEVKTIDFTKSVFSARPGESLEKKHVTFELGDSKASLTISKIGEFALGVKFLKCKHGIAEWSFRFNDGKELKFTDSRDVVCTSDGEDTIKVIETDSNTTTTSWLDLTIEPHSLCHSPLDPRIKELIAKGKTFAPADGKTVAQVLYNPELVVLYLPNPNPGFQGDIYAARLKDADFTKCNVRFMEQGRSGPIDSLWTVSIGEEEETHTLKFPFAEKESVRSWDKAELMLTKP